MKFETFTDIIDQFAGMEELHLQGLGEPMMHPRFFDMVEYAVKNRGGSAQCVCLESLKE
jgi:MoaA/NifB/PqqE/SkfB family radical SAM enzyme